MIADVVAGDPCVSCGGTIAVGAQGPGGNGRSPGRFARHPEPEAAPAPVEPAG